MELDMQLSQLEQKPCGCLKCRALHCFASPGAIHPNDIKKIVPMLADGTPDLEWCEEHLCIVFEQIQMTEGGPSFIPTLHPQLTATAVHDGKEYQSMCVFLRDDGYCGLRKHAPYGCSILRTHDAPEETADKMVDLLIATNDTKKTDHPFFKIVVHLGKSGNKGRLPDVEDRMEYALIMYKFLKDAEREKIAMN